MSELKITKEKVLAAAAKCSTAKETLKTLFPEAFEPVKEYFDFGGIFELGQTYRNSPFMIANGVAPSGYENKCICIEQDWDIEVKEHDGLKIIIPFKTTKP